MFAVSFEEREDQARKDVQQVLVFKDRDGNAQPSEECAEKIERVLEAHE